MKTEVPIQINQIVRRITASNSSLFTGPGTNTYLIGNDDVSIIDPGPQLSEHTKVIRESSSHIKRILLTHTHPDHSPGATLLQEHLDIPIFGLATDSSIKKDSIVNFESYLLDGDLIRTNEYTIEVIETPGHASNHLCFLLRDERMLFTGDHIMEGSTVVIAPPDGNMSDYLSSLKKIKNYNVSQIAPGHGEIIDNPFETIDWTIEHRLRREEKVIKSIKKLGSCNIQKLLKEVYSDVDPILHPIAEFSLIAHLDRLEELGDITTDDHKISLKK